MNGAMSIASTALRMNQTRLDKIGHNVANVNTVGFKSSRLDFRSAMYTTGLNPSFPRSPDEHNQKGHGVLLSGVNRNWSTGAHQRTERELDFALQGEGFFTLQHPNGDTVFTRVGSFHRSVEVTGTYLVDGNGLYVLNPDGGRIEIPLGTNSIDVHERGFIRFLDGENEEIGAGSQFGIVTFRNIKGLEHIGTSLFTYNEAAGEILGQRDDTLVRQGVQEGSNVDLSEEMTTLIRTQRAFQLASRALTTADEMEGIANNIRR